MGLASSIMLGLIASIGVATVAHDLQGMLGDWIRWHNVIIPLGSAHIYLSVPILIGASLFAWAITRWAR